MNQATSSSVILDVQNLSGGYDRRRPVLHQISFQVRAGELVGLIGLNGAGKSTTIKHILGLLQPVEGSIYVNGKELQENPEVYHRTMAYIPEAPFVYEDLTLWEHLQLTAMAYGLGKEEFEERVHPLLTRFQMSDRLNFFPGQMSKGMRQKVMIINAFLVQPQLLIVDEPFVGLDPLAMREIMDLFIEAKERGTAILMSSHILPVAEQHGDRFIILHQGRIRMEGSLQELRQSVGQSAITLEDLFLHVIKDELS
ncbi:ABC transporter ATP-binding protein [Rubeoparvulum massiliense]|uniref:ABC transporter ATP-binding protein n=1 Tax=Rubeoparvulum massiliense TaxID=1631346 RepID=UPI00065E875F|nr:ABC transporter ATP-binding protein [Rubeoparvulum massiliense]